MVESLSPAEVKKILDSDKNVKLIDVREVWEHETAKIPNSELMPLSNFINEMKKLNPKDKHIIYCHHGNRSLRVCNYLSEQGFENLINLDGGIEAWSQEIDSSIPTY